MLEGQQKRHYQCDCTSEMIQIQKVEDKVGEDGHGNDVYHVSVEFAIFLHGIINHEYSLKERLRHIWQIIKHKKPYGDYAILSVEEAKRMGKDLLKMTEDLPSGSTSK